MHKLKTLMNKHEYFMSEALLEACKAAEMKEVPVGAVIVDKHGEIIGRGFNQPISLNDPSAHAEIVAIRDAAKHLDNYRLTGCDLYVTIEPCTMCIGAMVHSRISTLIYGASEPKAGIIESQNQLHQSSYFNHQINVVSGVLEHQCSQIMQEFFKSRRRKNV